jgi:hypothetical protein
MHPDQLSLPGMKTAPPNPVAFSSAKKRPVPMESRIKALEDRVFNLELELTLQSSHIERG